MSPQTHELEYSVPRRWCCFGGGGVELWATGAEGTGSLEGGPWGLELSPAPYCNRRLYGKPGCNKPGLHRAMQLPRVPLQEMWAPINLFPLKLIQPGQISGHKDDKSNWHRHMILRLRRPPEHKLAGVTGPCPPYRLPSTPESKLCWIHLPSHLWIVCHYLRQTELRNVPCAPQKLKYLSSGPLQKYLLMINFW